MRRTGLAIALTAMTVVTPIPASAAGPVKKPPYWASIGAKQARMRTGPGRTYPASWLYIRQDLPLHVVAVFKEWRKVEDPGGMQGWMLGNLLSSTRTAVVQNQIVELRARPSAAAGIAWRAQPGVVGRLSECGNGWCRFDVHGQAGYVEQGRLWGVDPGEALP